MTMKKPIITYGKNNSTVKRKLDIDDDESRLVLKPRNPFDKNITVSTITNQALKPKKTTIQPTKKKLIQTCLVFGQKSKRIKCPICLMDYQQSSTEDVAIHNQFHLNFIKGLQWNGKTKGIISIKSTAPMSLWKRIMDVLQVVNKSLGAHSHELEDLLSKKCQIVLYISDDSKVVGLILAKPITLAYRVQETNHESVSTDSQQSISLSYNQSDPVEAICGISRIWVHETHRRQKIATLMLDSLRKEFLYGVELTTSQIAFSQPTRMGQSLATVYFSRHDFLVYVD